MHGGRGGGGVGTFYIVCKGLSGSVCMHSQEDLLALLENT
jgi:hypothetical protein